MRRTPTSRAASPRASELRDRGAPRVALDLGPHEPLRPHPLCPVGELVDPSPRELAVRLEAAHHAAGLERALEHLELGPLEDRAEIVDLAPEAPVRAVGAV